MTLLEVEMDRMTHERDAVLLADMEPAEDHGMELIAMLFVLAVVAVVLLSAAVVAAKFWGWL